MRDIGSVIRGLKAMTNRWDIFKYWAVKPRRGFWLHYWTPIWHKGRGPYLTWGLGIIAIYRGY
jgi:hypothetical protein